MEQYIKKSALVAEIDRRIELNNTCQKISGGNEFYRGAIDEAKEILSFLDTLEVKEVDLEKVFNDEYSKFSNDVDAMDYSFPIDLADYKDFAKHFYELGIKVAQKGD